MVTGSAVEGDSASILEQFVINEFLHNLNSVFHNFEVLKAEIMQVVGNFLKVGVMVLIKMKDILVNVGFMTPFSRRNDRKFNMI